MRVAAPTGQPLRSSLKALTTAWTSRRGPRPVGPTPVRRGQCEGEASAITEIVSKPRPLTVICDFDDTAASQNVARLLLDRFAEGRDKRHVEDFRAGRITFREYQERSFNEIHVPISEMEAHVRNNASLRTGFAEAVAAARQAGAGFAIASAGIEFYIRPLLEREGHGALPIVAVKATQAAHGSADPIRYDYPVSREGCEGDWAVCKCKVVQKAQGEGGTVIFVGDGIRSDACAAGKADKVFARAKLLEHCTTNGIKATPFDDFLPLAEFLRQFIR
ncbi:MAG: hypothetical protein EXR44_00325 [Dehalococcoidia bacterium]|nr:hypothetical protein [Dehalococcoidia bacterium]